MQDPPSTEESFLGKRLLVAVGERNKQYSKGKLHQVEPFHLCESLDVHVGIADLYVSFYFFSPFLEFVDILPLLYMPVALMEKHFH